MNKEEFEREALRIAESLSHMDIYSDAWVVGFANAIRDLLEKDAAENNPPVAWFDPEHGLPYGWLEEPPTENAVYLYLKPPIQQAPEGWQLVPKKATQKMLDVGHFAYENKAMDMASPTPTEFPEGGASEACYSAMLAAAPEYKEDK